MQQPFGHEVASQTHAPPLQRWPAGHAAFVPHLHSPLVHVLVVVGSHWAHVPPLVPHEVVDCEPYASQEPPVPPLQQPAGHVFASQEQVPFVASHSPFGQDAQESPPVPHSDAD